jgi:hypothetical protein
MDAPIACAGVRNRRRADAHARLGLLLDLFAVLVVMRAIIVARRNIKLAQIQTWFIEAVRARLASRLAAAPWPWCRVCSMRASRT